MRILLAVTSSISAYKTPMLVSMLKKQGHEIICAVTKNAQNMVGVKALETMSSNHVITDIWQEDDVLRHININKETDILLIAPADANIIGKIANGICDDAISTIACAYTKKKYFAPGRQQNAFSQPALFLERHKPDSVPVPDGTATPRKKNIRPDASGA